MTFKVNDDYLEDTLAKIERARNWSPRVISKLENLIRTAGDEELFRVSPLHWASQKSVDEYEAVDLFLYGAKAGLFYMEWDVICACCGKVSQSLRDLHSLESHSTCKLCFRKDRPTLDDSVQVTFTLSPSIRTIRFHHPETLTLEEYCFKYLFEPSTIISGAMSLTDAFHYVKRYFSEFTPGETLTVETEVGIGALCCFDVFGQQSFGLLARGEPNADVQTIAVRLTDRGFEVPLPEMQPGELRVGPLSYAGTFYPIRPGKVALEIEHSASARTALLLAFFPIPVDGVENITPELFGRSPELAMMVEPKGDGGYAIRVPPEHQYSSPRLTAKRLFASQTFHELFRAEVFQDAEGFGIKDVTILFTDLKSSTQLYQQIGDLNAFALVREHYGVLDKAVSHQHGAVVKTIGDAIMANFDQPVDAVAAALEMLSELGRLNRSSQRGALILKIGIHRGAAIAVTLNGRIDYFGTSVNIASRVQSSAGGNEIYLTEAIYNAAGVLELLRKNGCDIESIRIQLRDVEDQMEIYKVTAAH